MANKHYDSILAKLLENGMPMDKAKIEAARIYNNTHPKLFVIPASKHDKHRL